MLAYPDFRSYFDADDCRSDRPANGAASSDRGSSVGHRASNNESSDKSDAKARGARLPSGSINNAKGRKRKRQTEGGSDNDVYDPDNSPDNSLGRASRVQRTASFHKRSHRRPQAGRTQFASSPISRRSISSLLLVALIFILHLHLHLAQSAKTPYKTSIACEGDELEIRCEPNHVINVVRANFGRFSITICNKDYNATLPTKCVTHTAHRLIHKLCQDRPNCTVSASESQFDDHSCHGVPKYLEISYLCVNSNPSARNSKRPYLNRSQPPAGPVNKSSPNALLKNGRLNNGPAMSNGGSGGFNDGLLRTSTDAAIYDGRPQPSDPNELNNRKPANNDLDNNQNPFLYGKRVLPESSNRADADQSSLGQVNLNSLNSPAASNKIEIRESAKPALLDAHRTANLTNYCPQTAKRGVNFELTQAGKLVTVNCPAGATNAVSWYCAPPGEDGQRAMWYPPDRPDFSKCSSLWLNSMEERLKDKYPMISKLAQELASVTNVYQDIDTRLADQNSFLGLETPKRLNSVLGNERQQTLYARDLYRISEITSVLVNKLETFIEVTTDTSGKLPQQQQFNEMQRTKQSSLIHEMLIKLQDTVSNLLVEQNRESWLELTATERTLAISSLMSSLKKNALLFASVRPSVSSNFDRITRNLFIGVYVRQTAASSDAAQSLQLPIKRSARPEAGDLLTGETGDEESDDKQQASRCCSIIVSGEKMIEQSMQNLAKFIFIVYEQLGQLMPIEEVHSKKKRSTSMLDGAAAAGFYPVLDRQASKDRLASFSVVVSEIVSVFSQKESSIYPLPNAKTNDPTTADKPDPYIELTFIHHKFGLQENLTSFRCVQLQDSETVPYSINSRVLSVEQAAANEVNQPGAGQVSNPIDHRFLAQSSTCQTVSTNQTQTTCRCSTLGTFAVLADLGRGDDATSQMRMQNRIQLMLKLNRICIFSCGISAILLLITIVSFYFYKNSLRGTKTINHLLFLRNNQLPGHLTKAVNYQNVLLSNQAKINFLICLFFLECAMLVSLGLSESGQNSQVFCRLASLAIHYFLLTVFAWLLFDCFISSYLLALTESKQQQNQSSLLFNQVQPLVVLNSNGFTTTTTASSLDLQHSTRQYTLRTCKLLTYLLPLFIVVLSSWIDPSSYCSKSWTTTSTGSASQRSSGELYAICWHQFDNIYVMFYVVPSIALLLASLVFLVVSLALRMRRLSNPPQSNKQFTYLAPNGHLDVNKPPQFSSTKNSLFASNTRINLFNLLITACCWLFASFYLNNLLETFENFHFNQLIFETAHQHQQPKAQHSAPAYVEPLLTSNSFTRTFTQLPDSNLALFAFLFVVLNVLHCVVLFVKLAIRGLVGQICVQFISSVCLFKAKQQHSLNNLSQLYMPPSYHQSGDNQANSANLDSLKYDQKLNKFEPLQNGSLNSVANGQAAQQQPLIPPPQLITQYQLGPNGRQQFNAEHLMNEIADDDVYENDDQQHFSEQQSNSETMLASSDLQTSEQSDSEQFLLRNKSSFNSDAQYGKEFVLLKKNRVYGQKQQLTAPNQSSRAAQMENFYECIEDAGNAFYEPMIYSAAYGETTQRGFPNNKYNRLMNQQQPNFSDVDSEYENPIERFSNNCRPARPNNTKLLRNYSSNDFLNERDAQSRLDQPLLPAIIRDNTNHHPQFALSSATNHRNFNRPFVASPSRYNPANASFSSTIDRNALLNPSNSVNGVRTANFRASKQTKDMISEQEQNLKQIQQQLKQFQLQLAISSNSQGNNSSQMMPEPEELKDQQRCLNGAQPAAAVQQNSYLSSNSSVSDNVNSSV